MTTRPLIAMALLVLLSACKGPADSRHPYPLYGVNVGDPVESLRFMSCFQDKYTGQRFDVDSITWCIHANPESTLRVWMYPDRVVLAEDGRASFSVDETVEWNRIYTSRVEYWGEPSSFVRDIDTVWTDSANVAHPAKMLLARWPSRRGIRVEVRVFRDSQSSGTGYIYIRVMDEEFMRLHARRSAPGRDIRPTDSN